MKTILTHFALAAMLLLPAFSEEPKAPVEHTPTTVIIERFEAKDAKISDVLEALSVLAGNATNNAYSPNFVISGEGIGDKTLSMNLTKAPLAVALSLIAKVPDVITPFPGGIVRSGSKVGSKYKGMFASSNDAFCPTIRGAVKSELGPGTIAVLEIVIDGLTSKSVADAMRVGLKAVTDTGAARGVTRVSAGNYGGKLGAHHYHLKDLIA